MKDNFFEEGMKDYMDKEQEREKDKLSKEKYEAGLKE